MGQQRYERADVHVRAIYGFAAGLAVLLIVVQPIVGVLLRIYYGGRPVEVLTAETVDSGRAAHWQHPAADLEATRRREEYNLDSYEWIDQERGVLRVPVARAMELLVQRAGEGADAQERDDAGPAGGGEP